MRIVLPFSNTPDDETLGPDERQAFSSSKKSGGCRKGTGGTSEGNDEAGGNVKDSARPTAWGHERIVRVPKETARWVFTNQPQTEAEDAITMKVRRGCLFILRVDRPDYVRHNDLLEACFFHSNEYLTECFLPGGAIKLLIPTQQSLRTKIVPLLCYCH